MPDGMELVKRPAIERLKGEQPGRFKSALAAFLAGVGLAVAYYKWLRD